MKFDDAMSKIKDLDDGQALIDAITARISKVNTEAKGLKDKLKAFDGVDLSKQKNLIDALEDAGINTDDENIDEQLSALKENAGKSENMNSQISKLNRRYERLQKELAAKDAEAERLKADGAKRAIKADLASSFSEKVLNGNKVIDFHIMNGDFTVSDDGKPAYKRGDDIITGTDNIISAYLEDNPKETRNNQNSGAGSNPGAPQLPGSKFHKNSADAMTQEQIAALSDADFNALAKASAQ